METDYFNFLPIELNATILSYLNSNNITKFCNNCDCNNYLIWEN